MSARRVPGTQRAWARYDDGVLTVADNESAAGLNTTPVLVVPKSAVKGCRHENTLGGYVGAPLCCLDCGGTQKRPNRRWQRPRILRASK